MQVTRGLAALALVAAIAGRAHGERIIALAPLSTLGAEDKSTRQLAQSIEQAIAALGNVRVITAAQVADAIAKAKKPQLRACEGDAACVAELGKLVGAQIVVTGEVGGLGDSRVVYLGATDVATAKELRSTTLAIGAADSEGGPSGAAVRLLDPDHFRGSVHLAIDVSGASVFVNGSKVELGGSGIVSLPVGTQAIRVTHPEYHDFVRFVDVAYGKTVELPVGLQQYPILEDNAHALPSSRDRIIYTEPPLWRRWYVVAPAAVVLAIAAGLITGAITHDYPSTPYCRTVSGNPC